MCIYIYMHIGTRDIGFITHPTNRLAGSANLSIYQSTSSLSLYIYDRLIVGSIPALYIF